MVGVRGPASFSIRLVRKKDVSGIWPKNIGPLESCLTFPFFFKGIVNSQIINN